MFFSGLAWGFWALTAMGHPPKVPALSLGNPGARGISEIHVGDGSEFFPINREDGMANRKREPSSDLKARLAAARSRERHPWRKPGREAEANGVGIAVRVGIELAGTLAVGVGIGWLLDRWLGTGPWLLVLFFFLGAAAGVLNVYRAVGNIGLAPGYGSGSDEGTGPQDETRGDGGDGPKKPTDRQ